jgi:hypothetical protein
VGHQMSMTIYLVLKLGIYPPKNNLVQNFAEIERMELNPKKCKKMILVRFSEK